MNSLENFKKDLYTYLAASATVDAVIGDRIYANNAPQNPALPCVVYHIVDGQEEHAHDGPTGLEVMRVQFDCLGKLAKDCTKVRDAMKATMNGLTGTIGSHTGIRYSIFEQGPDDYDNDLDCHTMAIDFQICLQEI